MKKTEAIALSSLMEIISEVERYFDELGWPKSYGGAEACKKIKERVERLSDKTHSGDRA